MAEGHGSLAYIELKNASNIHSIVFGILTALTDTNSSRIFSASSSASLAAFCRVSYKKDKTNRVGTVHNKEIFLAAYIWAATSFICTAESTTLFGR